MSMQLFSFGHPCEHQLHRACIGGSNCPLNGYPDTWCCSFIKGKINFKRDRPCEGPRCHWDFVHPSQSQFDEVTQVLEQSRPIAAKLDEAKDTDLLSFQINNPHIIDTVQCALHMMRHPPSTCARRVGQLLAYAAVQAGDQDVFVQLLKTMKKPVDGYILGAYAFLTQSKSGGGVGGSEKGGVNQKGNSGKKQSKKKDSKDDISATLANIMVELMNAALSLGGQLVDREDQHVLQAMLIKALSTYPKNDKRHQEMLEKAVAKFGNRKLDDEEEAAAKRETARREAAAAAATAAATAAAVEKDAAASTSSATANAAATDGGETLGTPATKEEGMAAAASTPPTAAVAPTTLPPTANTTATLPAVVTAAADAVSGAAAAVEAQSGAAALPPAMPSAEREAKAPAGPSSERQTPRGTQEGVSAGNTPRVLAAAATPKTAFSSAPGTPGTAIAPAAAPAGSGPFHSPAAFAVTTSAAPSPQQALPPAISSASGATPVFTTTAASAVAGSAAAGAGARPPAPPSTASTATPAATTTAPTQPPAPSAAAAGPMVGISKIVPILRNRDSMRSTFKLWTWRRPPPPGPDLYLCGGQLTVKSHLWGPTPLGDATRQPILDPATLNLVDYMRTIDATHAANAARHEEAPSHHYDDVSGDSWIYDEYEWTDSDSDFEIFF